MKADSARDDLIDEDPHECDTFCMQESILFVASHSSILIFTHRCTSTNSGSLLCQDRRPGN